MGDLDVLVSRERFEDAHRLIQELGFRLATRSVVEPASLEHGKLGGGSEYVKEVGGEELWFELQWRAIAGRWIRRDQEPDGESLISRSVVVDGSDVRILNSVDNLIQVALHTAKHSYIRAPGLRLHTDVDRLVTYAPPMWDEFVLEVERLRVKDSVFFSLAMAEALLATPVPDWVLTRLAPPALKVALFERWISLRDVFEPGDKKFSRPEMMAFHAMLYDDLRGLLASALDTDPEHLGLSDTLRNARRGTKRVLDLVTRYQK